MCRVGIRLLCASLWTIAAIAASAAEPLGPTDLGTSPWDPATLTGDKVVYGPDDRVDVYTIGDSVRLAQAAATCALIDLGRITNNGNGTYTIATSAYTVSGFPACGGEPFGTQPVAAFCSGFLVADDIIATAGHCVDGADFGDCAYVFDWVMDDATTPRTVVDADQVYFGTALIAHALDGDGTDFSLVRLDRDVTTATPLALRTTGTLSDGEPVGVIGHPSGLPKKVAFGATTAVADTSNPIFFEANLDTYGGNSGSPVFNQNTGLVEGILVRGASDFVIGGGCFTSNMLADNAGDEDCTKVSAFLNFLPGPELSIPPGAPVGNGWMPLLAVVLMTAIALFLLRKQLN
jgi:hypothetical protein